MPRKTRSSKKAARKEVQSNKKILRLPQEMWDHTIYQLLGNNAALKACSLTCRAWWPTARKLLWRELHVVSYREGPRVPQKLRSLLEEQPDLAKLVHKLFVDLPIADIPLISSFTNMKELSLGVLHGYTVNAQETGYSVLSALEQLRIPSVTTLGMPWRAMSSTTVFERVLACFPNLSVLHAYGNVFDISEDEDEDGAAQAEESPVRRLSLPHLKQLKFRAPQLSHSLPRITHAAGPSLEFIEIYLMEVSRDVVWDVLDFSTNTCLTNLDVRISFSVTHAGWGDYLAAALSSINASHTSLDRIVLHLPNPLPDPETGPLRAWLEPGESLGRELSRVMDDLPNVQVVFRQTDSIRYFAAQQAQWTLACELEWQFPGLSAHPDRLRFVWNRKVWGVEDGRSRVRDVPLIEGAPSE
ncbi:hypothetical protein DAEQUDRAFT_812974 [Daedalea quercina L-15889]|uniref:F-box domain-containing protein n=1 Tax=Daedalea quercina L-15889 TaxID=1314783 RepID=A0A165NR85_9APHY|nr:hypothetical protein DAEQUDRAFT_812974 [Daedalea quercina L-15889]